MQDYCFTNGWFNANAKAFWDELIPELNPEKILEIGSFEGASACYLIHQLASMQPIELHCIDTWEGGIDNMGTDMGAVEERFNHNVTLAIKTVANPVQLVVHKGNSDTCLSHLMTEGKQQYFDFVYIDGSHQAPDVLLDAALGFKLLKVGGVMAFDDYTWYENLDYGKDPLRCPKPAIDAFVNINFRKLDIYRAPLCQLYIKKTAD